MKSYLISSLASRFGPDGLAEFKRAHDHAWLLWEPGAWRPARRATLVVSGAELTQPSKGAEALALALELKPGQEQLTLGRDEACELTINDGTLSLKHLLFMRTPDGTWTVRDAGSRNGSWLDGVQLEPGHPRGLGTGARLKAGQVALTFYAPAELFARIREVGGR